MMCTLDLAWKSAQVLGGARGYGGLATAYLVNIPAARQCFPERLSTSERAELYTNEPSPYLSQEFRSRGAPRGRVICDRNGCHSDRAPKSWIDRGHKSPACPTQAHPHPPRSGDSGVFGHHPQLFLG